MQTLETVFVRGGTSKGLFFRAEDLPDDPNERDALLCRAMGSPDNYQMQLDGMGGGISSLSKVVFVERSTTPGVDLDYTFGQVSVDAAAIDYSANCGNLTSAVAPFALYAGLVSAPSDSRQAFVLHNRNLGSRISARFATRDGQYDPAGAPRAVIPGVAGEGAAIDLSFADAAEIKAIPSGNVEDVIAFDTSTIRASIVFASAPVVFVRAADLGIQAIRPANEHDNNTALLDSLDKIRRAAAVVSGLADTPSAVPLASPKIAMVFEPHDYRSSAGVSIAAPDFDVGIQMVSMERPHRSITLTGAMCTAAAAAIEGTCVAALAACRAETIRIGHPAGVMRAGADVADGLVRSVSVVRTARLLMAGRVFV